MAEAMKVRCSECDSELTLKDQSAIGKKVRCPFCSEPFVVRVSQKSSTARKQTPRRSSSPGNRPQKSPAGSPAPPKKRRRKPVRQYDELDFLDETPEYDDYDDYESEEAFDDFGALPPPPRTQRNRKKRKRKKSSAAWLKPALMIFAILGGVGVLGGAIYFGITSIGLIGGNLNLAYLPPDSELIISIQVDDVWNSPFVQDIVNQPDVKTSVDQWKKQASFGPNDSIDDIKSITIGTSGMQNRRSLPGSAVPAEMIIVMRFKKRADMKEVEAHATKKQHEGETYYISNHHQSSGMALFLPDRKTVVMGSEEGVKAAITRGGKPPSRPELDFVDTGQQVLVIGGSANGSLFSNRNISGFSRSSDSAQQFTELAKKNIRYVCLGLTFRNGINVQFQGDCTDAESAAKLKEEMDKFLEEGRTKLTEAKQNAPSQLAEFLLLGDKILQSASTDQDGKTVSLAATVPEDVKAVFENVQQLLPLYLAGASSFGNRNPVTPPAVQGNSGRTPLGGAPSGTTDSPGGNFTPVTLPQSTGTSGGRFPFGNRIRLVEFKFGSFTGQGSQEAAARDALSGISGVQTASVQVLPGLNIIRLSLRTNSVDTGPMKSALEKAGFVITSTTVR